MATVNDRAYVGEYLPREGEYLIRYGAECYACDWNGVMTSTMRSLAQQDVDKHNSERHASE